jgi:hypothetical protein
VSKESSLETAAHDGLRLDNIPRNGWLRLQIVYEAARPLDDLAITAEFEDIGPNGSLMVECATTAVFRVRVDGRMGREGPGLIGLLSPGEHRLTFVPAAGDSFATWETTVTVVAGQTREVLGRLPWRPGGPFASWSPATRVPGGRALPPVFWDESPDPPTLLVDERSVRLVWSCFGDLWTSDSPDGRTFTALRRLELPVSSGWLEEWPKCLRDESGRFVLLFRGNRDARHEMHDYLCWSRGFEHWSAPFLVTGEAAYAASLPGDRTVQLNRLHFQGQSVEKLVPCRSSREVTLEEANSPGLGEIRDTVILRSDGRYELLRLRTRQCTGSPGMNFGAVGTLWRSLSGDGQTWSEAEPLAEYVASGRTFHLAAVQQEGRTVIMVFRDEPTGLMVLRETAAGSWERSPWIDGLGGPLSDLAYHPRWGFVLAWLSPGPTPKGPKIGPYVTRGAEVEALLRSKASPAVAARESAERFALARSMELAGQADNARWHYERVVIDWPDTPAAAESRLRLEAIARKPGP